MDREDEDKALYVCNCEPSSASCMSGQEREMCGKNAKEMRVLHFGMEVRMEGRYEEGAREKNALQASSF